jgi:hypothetical protein
MKNEVGQKLTSFLLWRLIGRLILLDGDQIIGFGVVYARLCAQLIDH